VEVVERDFTKAGKMKQMNKEQRTKIKGFLPFYSVDTQEEVDAIIKLALEAGEFVQKNGELYETTLIYNQSLDNLYLAGEKLAELHKKVLDGQT
jgi:hypothetical protein